MISVGFCYAGSEVGKSGYKQEAVVRTDKEAKLHIAKKLGYTDTRYLNFVETSGKHRAYIIGSEIEEDKRTGYIYFVVATETYVLLDVDCVRYPEMDGKSTLKVGTLEECKDAGAKLYRKSNSDVETVLKWKKVKEGFMLMYDEPEYGLSEYGLRILKIKL